MFTETDDIRADVARVLVLLYEQRRVRNPWLPGLSFYVTTRDPSLHTDSPLDEETEWTVVERWTGRSDHPVGPYVQIVAQERTHHETMKWELSSEGWRVLRLADNYEVGPKAHVWQDAAITHYPPPPSWRINIHSPATRGVLLSVLGEAIHDDGWHMMPCCAPNIVWRCCAPPTFEHLDGEHPQQALAIAESLLKLVRSLP